jgi:hypothetical protein
LRNSFAHRHVQLESVEPSVVTLLNSLDPIIVALAHAARLRTAAAKGPHYPRTDAGARYRPRMHCAFVSNG